MICFGAHTLDDPAQQAKACPGKVKALQTVTTRQRFRHDALRFTYRAGNKWAGLKGPCSTLLASRLAGRHGVQVADPNVWAPKQSRKPPTLQSKMALGQTRPQESSAHEPSQAPGRYSILHGAYVLVGRSDTGSRKAKSSVMDCGLGDYQPSEPQGPAHGKEADPGLRGLRSVLHVYVLNTV